MTTPPPGGLTYGGDGLSRAEIRAELHRMQGSRCAVCREQGKLVVDHDHMTGMARGLLCRSCNVREGRRFAYPDIEAYVADPPAAGRQWMWDLPDTWTHEDTAAVRRLGVTILEYLPLHLERAAERRAALQDAVLAMGRTINWEPEWPILPGA